jgi:hypothetical protein
MAENIAAIIRENEILRKVAAAAIRLREIGKACDRYDESLKTLWDESTEMPRSLTATIMFQQAFEVAMRHFDEAVLDAAAAGFDWLRENQALGPLTPLPHTTQGEK